MPSENRVRLADRVLYAPRRYPSPESNVAQDLTRYCTWVWERERHRLASGLGRLGLDLPAVALLVVIDRPAVELLERCLRSVASQTSQNWQLSVVVRRADHDPVSELLADVEASHPGQVLVSHGAPSTTTALSRAVDQSSAPFLLLLGQHDVLAPDALELLVTTALGASGDSGLSGARGVVARGEAARGEAAPSPTLVYADEDCIDRLGRLSRPALKSGWSPDLLISTPYLGRPFLIPRTLFDDVGGWREEAGEAWEYDLALRVTERATTCRHIAEVLYRRDPPPDEAGPAGGANVVGAISDHREAIAAALRRRGDPGSVVPGPIANSWRVVRPLRGRPRVLAVVPFRNGARLLRTCVDTVSATVDHEAIDLHFALVDNGSTDPEILTLIEQLAERPEVEVLRDPRPFNWSALNNAAATATPSPAAAAVTPGPAAATAAAPSPATADDLLLFLNNDIEAREPGWLEALVAQAQRPEVGVVGARLLYPQGAVQHVGTAIGLGGAAGHVLHGLPAADPGYLGMTVLARNTSAVTGACMITRRGLFEQLGGFDEDLGVEMNDVDFCLRVWQAGYRVVYEPAAELVHHESPSRGTSMEVSNVKRFVGRWDHLLAAGDPYLNANLTRMDPWCRLAHPGEQEWWQTWRSKYQPS